MADIETKNTDTMKRTSTNKWALLIGINKYPNLPPHNQLIGCINDIELMAATLRDKFLFSADNITMLRNEEATLDGIRAAMKALLDRVGSNDVVVMHYSGHGSQMTDREGDEPDGYDETIVPHDSGRSPLPNRDITDDEIYFWLLDLTKRTQNVTLVFDCCHSGTIARDAFGANERWLEPDERPVNELPPSPVTELVRGSGLRDIGHGPSGWLPLGERYVLIAGCADEESSCEHMVRKDFYHGALTYFLNQELNKAMPGTTYRDVFEQASLHVTAAHSRQHPQMEGARDRELFSLHDIEPMRFVYVKKRNGNLVTLGAGAAHGMTEKSNWAIYPQATKWITKEMLRLGMVEIADVGAVMSYATISEEVRSKAITEGCRAVEEEHFYGEMRLKVEIHAPGSYKDAANELAELIRESALLRLADAGEIGEARAYIIVPRTEVRKGDPVPQLGAINKPTWAVVEDGKLMMPVHTIDEAGVAAVLHENLEKIVRYRQALALKNPNEESLLKGKLDFMLKKLAPDGTWVAAESENAGGHIVFEEGERIAAEILNKGDLPVYVSVLDFGLTGAVTLLYPVAGASEKLEPGKSIQIGMRRGDEIELYIPDNFPYVLDPNDIAPVGGTETFKLFATTHEADFSILVQEGTRGMTRGSGTPLMQLLDMAYTGHGTRDPMRKRLSPDEEWTTVEHSFFLRRRM